MGINHWHVPWAMGKPPGKQKAARSNQIAARVVVGLVTLRLRDHVHDPDLDRHRACLLPSETSVVALLALTAYFDPVKFVPWTHIARIERREVLGGSSQRRFVAED